MTSPQKENGYTAIANEIMEALIKYPLPGAQMQCLLFILRKTYGFNKKSDFISLSQFKNNTGITRRNVIRALDQLQQKNIIHVKKGGVKNDTISISKYTFNKAFKSWNSGVKIDTGGVKYARKVVSKMTHTKDIITKDKDIYSSNFLLFWEKYPRKIGKGAAFKAYQNIKSPRPTLKIIFNSIETQNKSEQWSNKQFIPHPATWLNQRRWEDEVEETPINGNPPPTLTPEEQIEDFLS